MNLVYILVVFCLSKIEYPSSIYVQLLHEIHSLPFGKMKGP